MIYIKGVSTRMRMEPGSVERNLLAYGIVFGIACVIYLIVIAVLNIDTEVSVHRFADAETVFNGDALKTEYPPLALVITLIPRLFASSPFGYNLVFVIEMFVFFMIGLFFMGKLAERHGKNSGRYMLAYTVMMLMMIEFVLDRFDVVPAVLALVSVYCYVCKKYPWAFALLAVGAMIKLYPAILFPLFIIPLITARDWKATFHGTAVFAAVSLAVIIPVIIFQPDMLSGFVGYHTDRPLHVESVLASLIFSLAFIGLTEVWTEFGSSLSDNLRGAWPDVLAPLLTPLMIVSIAILYVVFAYVVKKTKNRTDDCHAYLFAVVMLLSLMLFIMVGKVFSAQYLIWLIPPAIFVLMIVPNQESERRLFILLIAAILMTQMEFAYNVGYLGGGAAINDLGMTMILLRNIIMIILFFILARDVYRRFVDESNVSPADGG